MIKQESLYWEISSQSRWWRGHFQELWRYRNLLSRLVRREFLLNYQQTILGPLWILLQPVLTLIVYVIIFGRIIGISTGSTPPVLFYLAGIILWNFFSESFSSTSFTFTQNAELFNKVYFPRLIVPLSTVISHFFRFLLQLGLLFLVIIFYRIAYNITVPVNEWIIMVPVILLFTGLMSLSLGLIFSVLTARYRDLANVVHLGIRLLMFATPVIYPMAVVPDDVKWIAELNPLSPFFEMFRFALFSEGTFTNSQLLYSFLLTIFLLIIALLVFNRQSHKLMDVV